MTETAPMLTKTFLPPQPPLVWQQQSRPNDLHLASHQKPHFLPPRPLTSYPLPLATQLRPTIHVPLHRPVRHRDISLDIQRYFPGPRFRAGSDEEPDPSPAARGPEHRHTIYETRYAIIVRRCHGSDGGSCWGGSMIMVDKEY